MSISAVGLTPAIATSSAGSEKIEAPGPDHDGDADDKGAAPQAAAAPLAPGTGLVVDKKA
jgi:hypothetical protein